jgi:GNAT superfamily N-acetyltransferase
MQAKPIDISAIQQCEIRSLTGDDAAAYFERRDHVLKIGDGHFFSDSYEREQALTTEQQRHDWCTEKHNHCIIGAFSGQELVGFVMITQYGQPQDSTVEWEAAWVNPDYRKTGLTKSIYEKVEKWTTDQGYRYVKSFIREDNKRWLEIRRKLGFVEIGTKHVPRWADGTSGNMIVLRLDLHAPKPQAQRTLSCLEETLSFLQTLQEKPNEAMTRSRVLQVAEHHL